MHSREAPAERDVKLLGKLAATWSSVAPVVLTDGMAAAIRETHLSYMPCITGKRCHAYPQHRVMNPPPCKYKFDLNNTVNCKVEFISRCSRDAVDAAEKMFSSRTRMYRRGLPQRTTGATYTLQFAEQSLSWRSSPRPCKSCKSLRTRRS